MLRPKLNLASTMACTKSRGVMDLIVMVAVERNVKLSSCSGAWCIKLEGASAAHAGDKVKAPLGSLDSAYVAFFCYEHILSGPILGAPYCNYGILYPSLYSHY